MEVTVGEGIIRIHGYTAKAMVLSGASTGRFEAVELGDGEKGTENKENVGAISILGVSMAVARALASDSSQIRGNRGLLYC